MKRTFFPCAIITAFLVILTYTSFAEETICLTNGEWPPYQSESLPHYGCISRIVTEAFSSEGITVKYDFMIWNRAFHLPLKETRLDGTIIWSYTPERAKKYYYSDPILQTEQVFFYRKDDNFDWKTYDDLKGLSVGATLGYAYGVDFKRAQEKGNINVLYSGTDIMGIKNLLFGRLDILAIEKDVCFSLLDKHFTAQEKALLTYHTKLLTFNPYSVLLKKSDPQNIERIRLFNKGLKALKESGKFDEYIKTK